VHLWYVLKLFLRFIISKEGKIDNSKKIKVLVKMVVPKTPQDIQIYNGMAHFYICFIIKFASIMAPITKLLSKAKVFEWTTKCQIAWEDIKN
jgi:hypothetical protein